MNALTKAVTYKISGPGKVKSNQKGVAYTLTAPAGTYAWRVPQGSTIISGQGTKKIKVNFGTKSGYVSAIKKGTKRADGQGAQLYVAVGNTANNFITISSEEGSVSSATAKVLLYPNPTASVAHLQFYNAGKEAKYQLLVTDISGKKLFIKSGTAIAGNNTLLIDLSRYAGGLYLVTLITHTETTTIKLYKK